AIAVAHAASGPYQPSGSYLPSASNGQTRPWRSHKHQRPTPAKERGRALGLPARPKGSGITRLSSSLRSGRDLRDRTGLAVHDRPDVAAEEAEGAEGEEGDEADEHDVLDEVGTGLIGDETLGEGVGGLHDGAPIL